MPDTLRAASYLDKGGTGKTTSIAHLGVALARDADAAVLLIDLAGKQGDLSKQFGKWEEYTERIDEDDDWPNVSTVFQDEWSAIVDRLGEAAIEDMILETDEEVDLIPSHPGLDSLDEKLGNIDDATDRYTRLRVFLDEYIDPMDEYDIVLIDLPGLSNNVVYNGLFAAEHVVCPVEAGPFESDQAERLVNDLRQINNLFDVEVELSLLLPNKIDRRTKLASKYIEEYAEAFGDAIAPEPIPVCQDLRNAAEAGHTIFQLETRSPSAKQACEAFLANSRFLHKRIQP